MTSSKVDRRRLAGNHHVLLAAGVPAPRGFRKQA
jgi:hypothetical protein